MNDTATIDNARDVSHSPISSPSSPTAEIPLPLAEALAFTAPASSSSRRDSMVFGRSKQDPSGGKAAGHVAGRIKGKGKASDEIEMIQFATGIAPSLERQKTDDALAKWRVSPSFSLRGLRVVCASAESQKWVVEHPADGNENYPSPLAIKVGVIAQPSAGSPPFSASSIQSTDPLAPSRSPSDPVSGSTYQPALLPSADLDVYNTESTRMLRDVELAVDPDYLTRSGSQGSPRSYPDSRRQMSTLPRLSAFPNYFGPIASRLASRRVRPIVLELIHALGYYIDILWTLQRPDTPCPWITDANAPAKPLAARPSKRKWTSKMVTAVQEGKLLGYAPKSPTMDDLTFWRSEVSFALNDVNAVVGIVKGGGWAFASALHRGDYGEVEDDNVFGDDFKGGRILRLLNDLEEALWGEGAPRSTDLAFELPIDFDPYALPSAEELNTGLHRVPDAPSPVLAFLSNSSSQHSDLVASPDALSMDQMPDMVQIITDALSPPLSPEHEQGHEAEQLKGDGSYWGFKNSEGLSWEEIGKRRHQEWLASRQASASSI